MDNWFDFFLIGAILVQGAISTANRKTGAIAGYFITTGILFLGLAWYGQSTAYYQRYLTYFGKELSVGGFLVVCLVWYGIDTVVLLSALRGEAKTGRRSARPRPRWEPPEEPEEEEEERPKRAARKPAAAAFSGITVCPKCRMKVFPKADGACPSCQAQIL
ncbi:MAG: hypothetical protein FD146_2573 [Anaerolineaceae bacterium]|nr:MAG: hypothetical protein FD146_2573 [Anaerolineaceae bacterium]